MNGINKANPDLTAQWWWYQCVRFGSSALMFTAGVWIGIAANIAVCEIMSYEQYSRRALVFLSLAALLFAFFSYCLHSLSLAVKEGEDAFLRAEDPQTKRCVYAANDTWNTLSDPEITSKKYKWFLFLAPPISLVGAFLTLIVAMANFPPSPQAIALPQTGQQQGTNTLMPPLPKVVYSQSTNDQLKTNVSNSK